MGRRSLVFSLLLVVISALILLCDSRPVTDEGAALTPSRDRSDLLLSILKDILPRQRRGVADYSVLNGHLPDPQLPVVARRRGGRVGSRRRSQTHSAFRDRSGTAADRGGWGGAYGR